MSIFLSIPVLLSLAALSLATPTPAPVLDNNNATSYGPGINTSAVGSCSARLDGKLPSFVPTGFKWSGNTRRYYLSASEVEWDYIPSGWDNMRGVPLNESNSGSDSYLPSNTSIGHKYLKGLYRGYTDQTFTTPSDREPWLGFQGPVIRAEVGDMVEVLLYNNFTDHPLSMHAMGLTYTPESEGAIYYTKPGENGQAYVASKGSAIPAGDCYVYKWLITNGSRPDANLPSKLWAYHGDLNLQYDVETGLVGPVIVYPEGKLNSTIAKHPEFVVYYSSTDETNSWFLNKNIQKYLPDQFNASEAIPAVTGDMTPTIAANSSIWGPINSDVPPTGLNTSLAQSFMHLNGYAFSNMPGLEVCQDDEVIWHFWSMGVFDDGYHVVHFHGNNVRDNSGSYTAAVQLMPATMRTLTMTAQSIGDWQILCHVGDHWQMGMNALYHVVPKGQGRC